jgi:Ala-tRNA(Pro) deacylase
MNESDVYARLAELGIPYERYDHPPLPTVEEAERHWVGIEATHCKNLFLRNPKGNRHYLVIVGWQKPIDLRQLAAQIGDGRLSFASPERLKARLGLEPGSVSPFGLINDPDRAVHVVLDRDLKAAARLSFHPNVNTRTIVIAGADFERYLAACGNIVRWVTV